MPADFSRFDVVDHANKNMIDIGAVVQYTGRTVQPPRSGGAFGVGREWLSVEA